MPDPTPYHPSFSFSGFQSQTPEVPLPGVRVDTEYQNIEAALGETQTALADIRRDDGQLQNGIVTPDSLAPGMSLGVLPPTSWTTGVHYYPPAGVWYGNKLYQCVVEHVSTVFDDDLADGYWNLVVDFQPPINQANAAAAASEASAQRSETAANAAESDRADAQAAAIQAANSAQLADDARVAAEQAKADTIAQVGNAQAAATAAAASASNAQARANEAQASATAAANSATAASGSATAAGNSASAAAGSANAANLSAGNAATSASAAHTDAINASTSATNAANSATNAGTSAGNAENAKIEATAQAGFAQNSATAAANSATLAQNALGAIPGNWAGFTFVYSHFFGAPSGGRLQLDVSTPATATRMYIHDSSADSTPFRPYAIANLAVGMKLYLVNETDPTRYVIYLVSGAPVLQTGYTEVPITYVGGSGNALIVDTRATLTALGGGGAGASSSDAPPASPVKNQLWWESDTGNLYIYYDDGNTQQWVQISGPGSAVAPLGQCYLTISGANLLLQRDNGSQLWINGKNETVPAAGVTLAPSGLAASTLYWIYAYMNAGVMTLTQSANVPVTDAASGMRVMTGDATRTFVGAWRSTPGSGWETNFSRGASWFNPKPKTSASSLQSPATTSTGYVELAAGSLRVDCVCLGTREVKLAYHASVMASVAGADAYTTLGIDGANGIMAGARTIRNPAVAATCQAALELTHNAQGQSEGFHFFTPLGSVSSTNTGTWSTSYLEATILG